MKKIYFILCLLLMVGCLYAQDAEALRKIEAAKIALITERLNLSTEQAEKFWPIYNEYFQKQREVRQEFSEMRKSVNPKTASEEQNKRLLEVGMRVKENQLKLEREYSERLLKVISNRQMVNLRKAEEDFRKLLMEKMRERQQRQRINQNQRNEQIRKRSGGGI